MPVTAFTRLERFDSCTAKDKDGFPYSGVEVHIHIRSKRLQIFNCPWTCRHIHDANAFQNIVDEP